MQIYYQHNTKEEGTYYYELFLVYVDDVLACSHDVKVVMARIAAEFEIKNDNIAEPNLYLGGNVWHFQLPNGKYARINTSTSYVKGDIDTVQRLLAEDDRALNTGKRTNKVPLPQVYKPDLYTTYKCDDENT